jgi:hydroxypyruvate isomerase
MPQFAANLSMLFTEAPLPDRIGLAARAGFRFVEFQFPYAVPAAQLRAELDRHQVQAVLHNVPAGQWERGERGIGCHPDRVDEFRAGIEQAVAYATTLGVPRINVLAGKVPAGVPDDALRRTFVANLRHAAQQFRRAGLALLIEPINRFDVPGFYVNHTAQALEILDEVGEDNAFVQYDVYHAQRSEGEIAATLQKHLARIGHVQIADNPGRHEPGTGELNWDFLFAHLDRIGYRGQVGAEYIPAAGTEAGLGWLKRHGG